MQAMLCAGMTVLLLLLLHPFHRLASDVYYPALCQPNVQVVTSAVKEVGGPDGTISA